MVDTLNLLLLKKYEATPQLDYSPDFIDHWLRSRHNYDRLQQECEKIWNHFSVDPGYDAERAFRVLGQRFIGICWQETQGVTNENQPNNPYSKSGNK